MLGGGRKQAKQSTNRTVFKARNYKNACRYGNSINFFKIFKFRILKSINFKKKYNCCYLLQYPAEQTFACYVLPWIMGVHSPLSGLFEANPKRIFEALVQERQRVNQNWEVDFQYGNAETPNEGVVSLC